MDYMSIALLNMVIIKQFIHACYGDLKKISERGYIFMTFIYGSIYILAYFKYLYKI